MLSCPGEASLLGAAGVGAAGGRQRRGGGFIKVVPHDSAIRVSGERVAGAWPAAQHTEDENARLVEGIRGRCPSLWVLAGQEGRSKDRSGKTGIISLVPRGDNVLHRKEVAAGYLFWVFCGHSTKAS